jgi:hypothetical protein
MKVDICDLCHKGDILATPFFLILSIYFYNIENKSLLENVLYAFSISCFLIDSAFTYFYVTGKTRH